MQLMQTSPHRGEAAMSLPSDYGVAVASRANVSLTPRLASLGCSWKACVRGLSLQRAVVAIDYARCSA
jgi:hypothetical protein